MSGLDIVVIARVSAKMLDIEILKVHFLHLGGLHNVISN